MNVASHRRPLSAPVIISSYGILHFGVDAICAALIASMQAPFADKLLLFTSLVITYNVLAFGLQLPFGMIADRFRIAKIFALTGALLTSVSPFVAPFSFTFAIVCAGLGNALFHLGGGAIAYSSMPGQASGLGAFVAPGAVGLFAGSLIGAHGGITTLAIVVVICTVGTLFLSIPPWYKQEHVRTHRIDGALLIGILLFLSIFIRSLSGLSAGVQWKSKFVIIVSFVMAAFLGKLAGGFLADRCGWTKTCLFAMLTAAPLIAFSDMSPYPVIISIFLIQITMGPTFAAMFALLPGKPSTAFGIGCMALLFGALPVFSSARSFFEQSYVITILTVVSGVLLIIALGSLQRAQRCSSKEEKEYELIAVRIT